MKKWTAGSLFSGIGGIDLAFSLAGFDICFQVEIDDFCQKVLTKHSKEYWPNAEIFTDVRRVGKHNLPSIDVLFGGFPCQDISGAGKQAGLVDGKNSSLWFEFARIIGEIRPKIILLENVAAIISPRKKDGEIEQADMGLVIGALSQMGYDTQWGIISASDANAPHERKRWFCLAYTNSVRDKGNDRAMAKEENDCWEQDVWCKPMGKGFNIRTGKRNNQGYRIRQRQFKNSKRPKSSMGRDANGIPSKLDGYRLMSHKWPAKPNEKQRHYEPMRIVYNQSSDVASRIKALGNAVVPQVVYPIACEIRNRLDEKA